MLGSDEQGVIRAEDMSDDPGFSVLSDVRIGYEIEATVVRMDDGQENILLSKKEADDVFAWAPRTVLIVIQFLRPMVKFLGARSEAESSIGTSPFVRNTLRYSSGLMLYARPFAVSLFGRTSPCLKTSFIHAKNSSTNGLMEV